MNYRLKTAFRTVLLGSAAAAAIGGPAFAQAQESASVEEIVVTGSRIRRDTFNAPVPLSVVSSEDIRASGNISLAETLLDVPVIAANTNAQNSSSTLFLAGQARADIRGLGPSRTLVLMDGRRMVFSDASSPAVDLNLIPSMMVERVETVAGGASAVYGSEAISGVVNFIMKKRQDGLELDAQIGTSQEGDGEEFRLAGIWGGRFLDDKLNILVGAEASRQEPVFQRDRDWAYPGIRRDNTLTPQPIIRNSRTSTTTTAAFQLLGGAPGTARAVVLDVRNPTQIVRLSNACSTPTVQPTCQDEALPYAADFTAFQAKSARGTFRGYADYDLTDKIKAFADFTYSRVDGYGYFSPAFSNTAGGGTMPIVFRGDNAYLNGAGATAAALRTEWLAAGKTLTQSSTAQIGKAWNEFGGRDVKTERETTRAVIGMEGEFEAIDRTVHWDWYAQAGKTVGTTRSFNVPILARVQQAVDAITVNGQVVCRDVTARAAGCVPWDLVNGPSREAVLWANANSTTDQEVNQRVIAANLSTDLFELPAGPVGIAFGGEYRKEESEFHQDALGAAGALFFNAVGTRAGEYDTKEAYGEIRVPILRDLPFAKDLTFEAAGRLAKYSTIGKTDQYRVALEWAPVQDVRFRANQGTAVRAPNIVELYSPQSRNFTPASNPAQDPCDRANFAAANASQQAARRITCAAAIPGWNPATFESNIGTGRSALALLQGGNPNLDPEKANTYQVGVVVQPRWVPGLQVSVDWFKYIIDGQINTLVVNNLLANLCHDSATPYASNPYCAQIRRDPTGNNGGGRVGGVAEVTLTNQNIAKVKVEGYDASISYGFRTEDLFQKDYGDVAMRVDATWMYRWEQQASPGLAYTQYANTVTNATPEWKVQGSVQWTKGDLGLTWTTNYIGSMISTTSFAPSGLTPYYTGAYYKHDVRARYHLNDQFDLRAGIQNVTNETPPMLPETYQGIGTGSSSYDNRGRYFYMGATFRY